MLRLVTPLLLAVLMAVALAEHGPDRRALAVPDITAPELVSIGVSPLTLDTSTGPAKATVTVGLKDDISGVAAWSITFFSPTAAESATFSGSPGLVSGTIQDGVFQASVLVPQGSEEGTWKASSLSVSDVDGNATVIDLSASPPAFLVLSVISPEEDITPPDLIDISINPATLDVTSGGGFATVTAHITDDLSGTGCETTTAFYGSLVSPSGKRSRYFSTCSPSSGTELDGTFEAQVFFPQYTEPGVWNPGTCYESLDVPPYYRQFPCVTVCDNVGNCANIDLEARGLLFGVDLISPGEDVTPPELLSIEVDPSTVNLKTSDGFTIVRAHLTDDLSGVGCDSNRYGFSGTLTSPSERRNRFFATCSPTSGTELDGTFEAFAFFPQYTEGGTWKPGTCYESLDVPPYYRQFPCVTVCDNVGNCADIDLEARGLLFGVDVNSPIEDVTAPALLDIGIAPPALDLTGGDGLATVSAQLTDDLSGVGCESGRYGFSGTLLSPSERRSRFFGTCGPTSGTELDGTFEAGAFFPQYTEGGVWKPGTCYESLDVPPYSRQFPCVTICDNVGNCADVDLESQGFSLTLGVISALPGLSLELEPHTALNPVGTGHTVTATLTRDGEPLAGQEMRFEVIAGPHVGTSGSDITDAFGRATFTYTGTAPGTDTIIASVDINGDGEIDAAAGATKEWTSEPPGNPPIVKTPRLSNLWLCQPVASCADPAGGVGERDFNVELTSPITSTSPKGEAQTIGSFEFEVRYDAKFVSVTVDPGPLFHRADASCATTPGQGFVQFRCNIKSKPTDAPVGPGILAVVRVRATSDVYSMLIPNQQNGIATQLINQGCQLSDLQGHPIQMGSCDNAALTIRYLEGDVNADCVVNVQDQQQTAFRWGSRAGNLLYNSRYDLEPAAPKQGDGDIDAKDLQVVYGRHGSTCQEPHPAQPPVDPKATVAPPST